MGTPARSDGELSQHVAVIGDAVAPFMARPDTDPAALRAADSLAILPDDPVAGGRGDPAATGGARLLLLRLRRGGLRVTRAGRRRAGRNLSATASRTKERPCENCLLTSSPRSMATRRGRAGPAGGDCR